MALHVGALALVQPLLVSGLLFALLLRHLGSRSITRQEVAWAVLLTNCVIGFLVLSGAVTNGTDGPAPTTSKDCWRYTRPTRSSRRR